MMARGVRAALTLIAAAMLLEVTPRAGGFADPVLTALLDRVSASVSSYYQRTQTIVSTETIRVQPLIEGLTPFGAPARFVYEARTELRQPDVPGVTPEPSTTRRLVSATAKEPLTADGDTCAAADPLFIMLREHRRDYGFSMAGRQRVDGRDAIIVDFISLPTGTDKLSISEACVNIPLDGRTRGHVWIDAETDAVLKLDNHLVGFVEVKVPKDPRRNTPLWLSLERWDYSIRYAPVTFTDPDESVMLPVSVETVTVLRGAEIKRTRVTQTYSDYQRFIANSRLIRPPVEDAR